MEHLLNWQGTFVDTLKQRAGHGAPRERRLSFTEICSPAPVIGVALAGGLIVLLAGFATLQAMQLRRITRERDRADRVTEFMSGMFKVSDPSEARGNSITAREILDKAAKDVDSWLCPKIPNSRHK